jgi:hypothetical protein
MTRKTATAAKDQQPDLLGGTPAQAKPQKRNAVAKAAPKTTKQDVAKISDDHKPGTLLSIIRAVIENPNVPAEKVQMFFDMQMKAEAEAARRSFTRAKLDMRPHLPVINKDGKIEISAKDKPGGGRTTKQVTPYATFENIMSKIDKPLQDHGFDLYFTTEPTPDGSRIIVIGHLDHVDGHSVTTSFPLPAETSGSKNNAQGWMSALGYGKRGDTVAILNLRTKAPEDRDNDGADHGLHGGVQRTVARGKPDPDHQEADAVETITQVQAEKLIDAIEACGAGRAKVIKHYSDRLERKLVNIQDLPADLFDDAMQACKNYEQAQKDAKKHG